MILSFLGTGTAFNLSKDNYQSNMLLEDEHKNRLLIDCGTDARHSLHEFGLSYADISDVYISHLHADHAGGLEWLGFASKFDPRVKQKPRLFISENLVAPLWDHKLSGGMLCLPEENAHLKSYFDVQAVSEQKGFKWQNINFNLVPTIHTHNNKKLVPSYGLSFTADMQKIFITTDCQFAVDHFMPYYEAADIIFHDCSLSNPPVPVHANYSQLSTLPPEIKAKMWLYHYDAIPLPDALSAGFRGFVKKGQRFDFASGL